MNHQEQKVNHTQKSNDFLFGVNIPLMQGDLRVTAKIGHRKLPSDIILVTKVFQQPSNNKANHQEQRANCAQKPNDFMPILPWMQGEGNSLNRPQKIVL